MRPKLYALPDGRHIAVGTHASIAALDRAQADMEPHEHAVVLDANVLGDHHTRIEQELRDARRRIAAFEAERESRTVWYAQVEDSFSQPYATRQLAIDHAEALYRAEFGEDPIEWRPFPDDPRAEPELRMMDDDGYPLPWCIRSGPILTAVESGA